MGTRITPAVVLVTSFLLSPSLLFGTNVPRVVTRGAVVAVCAIGGASIVSSGGPDLFVGSMGASVTIVVIMNASAQKLGRGVIQVGPAAALVAGP